MPTAGRLVAFALISLAIVVVPGPSVLFVVSRGLALGRRAALLTVLGNEAGLSIQVVAVAFGLGAIVERSLAVFTVLKLAGAAYLVYLGVQTLRHRGSLAAALETRAATRSRRIFRDGLFVGSTNPKSAVLFTAILPQFVNRSAGNVTFQLLVLGVVSVAIALVCDSTWGIAAGGFRGWLGRSPRRLAVLGGTGGLTLIGVGVGLAVTGRTD